MFATPPLRPSFIISDDDLTPSNWYGDISLNVDCGLRTTDCQFQGSIVKTCKTTCVRVLENFIFSPSLKVAVVTFCCRAGGHTPHPSSTPYSEPSINVDLQYHLTAFPVNNKPSYLNSLDLFKRYRRIIIIIIITIIIIIPPYKI